ncbi:MAG: hypothetical protein HamCj_14760 [Candidatus Hamiltonella defensa (Ceratovacuna japonica)]
MNILYTNFHLRYGGSHDIYVKNLASITQADLYFACPGSSNLYMDLKQADK